MRSRGVGTSQWRGVQRRSKEMALMPLLFSRGLFGRGCSLVASRGLGGFLALRRGVWWREDRADRGVRGDRGDRLGARCVAPVAGGFCGSGTPLAA